MDAERKSKLIWGACGAGFGLLVTPVAMFLALCSCMVCCSGRGGDGVAAACFYPFQMLAGYLVDQAHMAESFREGFFSWVLVPLAAIQFPVLGWSVGVAWRTRDKRQWRSLGVYGILHIVLAMVVMGLMQ